MQTPTHHMAELEFRLRLQALPAEAIGCIAARAALRSIPYQSLDYAPRQAGKGMLIVWRANSIGTLLLAEQARIDDQIRKIARGVELKSSGGAQDIAQFVADRAGKISWDSVTAVIAFSEHASSRENSVDGRPLNRPSEIASDVDHAETSDIAYLRRAPLWRHMKIENLRAWPVLKTAMQTDPMQHWEVWIDWYEARLRGDPVDWELQRAITLIPDEVWQGPPRELNGRIKDICKATGDRLEGAPSSDAAAATAEAMPAPLPTAIIDAALGEWRLTPGESTFRLMPRESDRPKLGTPPIRRDFINRVRAISLGLNEIANDLEADLANVPRSLLRAIRRYSEEAAREEIYEINPDILSERINVVHDACQDSDIILAIDTLNAKALDRHVAAHDALMHDFYVEALERQELIGTGPDIPEDELATLALQAAEAPRELASHLPAEAARIDPRDQAALDAEAAEIEERARDLPYLPPNRREAEAKFLEHRTRRLVATVAVFLKAVHDSAFVTKFSETAGEEAAKWSIRLLAGGWFAMAMAKAFGATLPAIPI